jgi:hypothetical protein
MRSLLVLLAAGSLAGCKSANCAPTKTARDEARRGLSARPTARETDEAVKRLLTVLAPVKDDASDDRTWSMLKDSVRHLSSSMSALDQPATRERTRHVLSAFQANKGGAVAMLEEVAHLCDEN